MDNKLPSHFSCRTFLWCIYCIFFTADLFAQQVPAKSDSTLIKSFFDLALTGNKLNEDLLFLTKKIGPRISGSANAQKSVDWARKIMMEINPDSVYLQRVMVPHWERGAKEISFFKTGNKKTEMTVCAFGGSVATDGLLHAKVIEVNSWTELAALKESEVKGRFIFFNRAMDLREVETYKAYLGAVDQRSKGAIEAAKKGAIGVLVRSLTLKTDDIPHTGAVGYDITIKKIPAAAIGIQSAEILSVALRKNANLTFSLHMQCKQLPEEVSYNLIGELRGTTFPKDFITVGAHLDSWDLGEGAADDGTGVVQTLEVLRILKNMDKRPERSFRAILYMNEESGAHGAIQYAKEAREKNENHIAVLESDVGGFTPRGFRVDGSRTAVKQIKTWMELFVPYGVGEIYPNQRGIDLVPMKGLSKVLISLECDDQRFFDIHHSTSDTYDKLNIREVKLGAASMTSLAYLILKYGL
ncbi:MAG: M20/M25/M40 family metallo-hydrolase [Mucilaginibacter sp.]|uniref:M20/M25/M40 family metallo-hydrolase n=1 Tax=Mucilaginibacter sp. TaxID=1882438 RepID=UPI0032646AE1